MAAYGNQRTSDGKPVFFEGDIRRRVAHRSRSRRIYFGEQSPDFSIRLGAPSGAGPREDPLPELERVRLGQHDVQGDGGVNILARSSASWRTPSSTGTSNFLLSDAINASSQILYDREPRERVQKVAPWLTLDGDLYPAVIDGHIEWIVDGYTTSANYPYSPKLTTLNGATSDSLTATTTSVVALGQQNVNYIKNSVKATVYRCTSGRRRCTPDPNEPLLKAWMGAFPVRSSRCRRSRATCWRRPACPMMAPAATALVFELRVPAEGEDVSAVSAVANAPVGDYTDLEHLLEFSRGLDVLTFDHEHVPTAHLQSLIGAGVNVHPGPDALVNAQDKLVMRAAIDRLELPNPKWAAVANVADLVAFGEQPAGRWC